MADEDGNRTASSAIWAITLLIVIGMIVGAVYYSGILKRGPAKQQIDVHVDAPAR
jgi:hypothetical protein